MLNNSWNKEQELAEAEEDIITRVAWLYYQEKMTQQQIAEWLTLSRPKVQRLLERAKDLDVVRFQIKHPYYNVLAAEQLLIKRFGLRDAVVVPVVSTEQENLRRSFAKACGTYLERLLRSREAAVIGFGWGNTTSYLADYFDPPGPSENVEVVSLIGNLMVNVAMNPYISAERIAGKLGAPFYNMWAPAIAQSKERAEVFKSEPWIEEVLNIAARSDVVVISIGELSQSASLFEMGYLSAEDLKRLQGKGAVGDIIGRFIDSHGKVVSDEIHDRVIGIPLELLKESERLVIGVAGGPSKHASIRGAVIGGFVDVLITDEDMASRLTKTP